MVYPIFLKKNTDTESELAAKKIVDRIVASAKITPQDHMMLTSVVMADGEISETNRRQVNRIFDYIQTGRLQLVDW